MSSKFLNHAQKDPLIKNYTKSLFLMLLNMSDDGLKSLRMSNLTMANNLGCSVRNVPRCVSNLILLKYIYVKTTVDGVTGMHDGVTANLIKVKIPPSYQPQKIGVVYEELIVKKELTKEQKIAMALITLRKNNVSESTVQDVVYQIYK